MSNTYIKARRYATKCGRGLDLVHDAYIVWWDKTKQNLFDEPIGTVIRVMKNVMFNQYQKQYQYRVDGSLQIRVFQPIEHASHIGLNAPPDDAILLNEVLTYMNNSGGTRRAYYDWFKRGYNDYEIAEIEGYSPQNSNWHRKALRRKFGYQ